MHCGTIMGEGESVQPPPAHYHDLTGVVLATVVSVILSRPEIRT